MAIYDNCSGTGSHRPVQMRTLSFAKTLAPYWNSVLVNILMTGELIVTPHRFAPLLHYQLLRLPRQRGTDRRRAKKGEA